MKLAFLFAFFVPLLTFADYVPNRTRPTAEAQMEAVSGDGKFSGVKSVRLVELSTDGKGITHYQAIVDGKKYSFAVQKASGKNCGFLFEASGSSGTRLVLRDLSLAECDFRAEFHWEAQLVSSEGGRISHLYMGGNPEHFVVSQ